MAIFVPSTLDGASVELLAGVGEAQRATRRTRHSVNGFEERAANLAIVRYSDDPGYYLFYCSVDWEVLTDTYHAAAQEAVNQANYEFDNLHFLPRAEQP
ncbi:hypothetical protein [Streptomyces fuscigenes]|uniref:hypothetical protein n=1 Tax=Streptomyces fuscigenes TaxID=1528880 RepID=UPI001F439B14|nr:hypothetical protein [Streptomyces fuscigenes]MCF3960384.1 hypothetical protein [Streptomyces fuscigenes]